MKLKAPPVRVHSDRGENVRIGLVRQPVLIFGILVVPERTFTVAESRGRSKNRFGGRNLALLFHPPDRTYHIPLDVPVEPFEKRAVLIILVVEQHVPDRSLGIGVIAHFVFQRHALLFEAVIRAAVI